MKWTMVIHQNAEYQTMIDYAETCIFNVEDHDTTNKALLQLELRSQKDNDSIGLAVVQYLKFYLSVDDLKLEESKKIGKRVIELCEKANLDYYLMRCYNCLAIVDSEFADYHSSFTNYLKAYEIAEENPEYKFCAILLNNIGNLFAWLNEHEIALDYLLQAYSYIIMEFSAESLRTDNLDAYDTILINIIEEYSILGKYDQIEFWNEKTTMPEVKNQIQMILNVNEIDKCYQAQHLHKIPALIQATFARSDTKDNFIYTFRICLRLLSLCIDKNDFSSSEIVLHELEHMNKNRKMDTFVYDFIIQKYHYYETFQYDLEPESQTKIMLKEYAEEAQMVMKLFRDTYTKRMKLEKNLNETRKNQEKVEYRNRQLERDLEKDTFTGILNKNSVKKCFEDIHLSMRDSGVEAFMLIDIDHFKTVNDTYGHQRGDEVIMEIVEMISSCCTKNMMFGRYGGDEFLLYIYHTIQTDYISAFANELLQKAHTIKVAERRHITLSIGVCILHKEDTFQSAFNKADESLYITKDKGRDGFTIYEQLN